MKKVYLFATLIATFWAGPTQAQRYYTYATNMANMPVFLQKNQGMLGVGWSGVNGNLGVDLQASYSPREHVIVLLNHFNAVDRNVKKQKHDGTSYALTEIGAGLFKRLPRGSASITGGFGYGNLQAYFGTGRSARFGIQRWYLQPAISYEGEILAAGAGIRITRVQHSRGEVDFSIDSEQLAYIRQIELEGPFLLPELCLRGGFKVSPFLTFSVHVKVIFPDTYGLGFAQSNIGINGHLKIGKKKA